jgi:hypothetical protein
MAIDPRTINEFKKVVLLADKIMKAQKTINPRFDQDISNNLPKAIKDKDGSKIDLYLAGLKACLKDIEVSLDDARTGLMYLKEIEIADEDFVGAHLADMDTVRGKISGAQSSLTKQFADGKKFQMQAEAAMAGQQKTQDKANQQVAEFDKWINDEKTELKAAFQKSDQIASKAKEAFEARDAKSLADAQKAAKDLGVDVLEVSYNGQEKPINEFIEELDKSGFEADAITELKKAAQDTLSLHKANKTYLDELLRQQGYVNDFKLEAVDVKKAAKTLGLDSKAEAKLAKVLTGTRAGMEKGLDALAKELKLKTNGKQMLAALDKAGLV